MLVFTLFNLPEALQPVQTPNKSKKKTLPQITDIDGHATGTQKSQTLPQKVARSPRKAKGDG